MAGFAGKMSSVHVTHWEPIEFTSVEPETYRGFPSLQGVRVPKNPSGMCIYIYIDIYIYIYMCIETLLWPDHWASIAQMFIYNHKTSCILLTTSSWLFGVRNLMSKFLDTNQNIHRGDFCNNGIDSTRGTLQWVLTTTHCAQAWQES